MYICIIVHCICMYIYTHTITVCATTILCRNSIVCVPLLSRTYIRICGKHTYVRMYMYIICLYVQCVVAEYSGISE